MNKEKPNKPPQEEDLPDKMSKRMFWLVFMGINIPWFAFTIWLGAIFPVLWDNDGILFFTIGMTGFGLSIGLALFLARRYHGV